MIATAGASLALVAALVGTGLSGPSMAAFAAPGGPDVEQVRQTPPKPAPKPDRPRPSNEQREQMHQAYLSALAGRLGISVDQLKAAMQQTRIDQINQAVAAGKLDRARADQMIQAIQSGQRPGQGQPGPGQRGPGGPGRPGAMGPDGGVAIAGILGLTPEQLRTEMQAGKSLGQIADAQRVSRDTLKAKLLEAQKARLDAAVAGGRITAQQAQEMAARMTANVDRMINATPGQRRPQQGPGAPAKPGTGG